MNAPRDTGTPVSDGPRPGDDRGATPGASRTRLLGLVVLVVLVVIIAMYITGDAFRDHPPPVT